MAIIYNGGKDSPVAVVPRRFSFVSAVGYFHYFFKSISRAMTSPPRLTLTSTIRVPKVGCQTSNRAFPRGTLLIW
jgi:hypothetical protein